MCMSRYVYVACRAVYPLLMGNRVGRMIRLGVLASTIPQYAIVAYYLLATLAKVRGWV